ncbi:MAG: helix-turn-helix domain-containing protein, partial [Actinobacteria bacterium]|nr:helix-turn-helix domain-containing protein [Actinomycetota bacterium]
GMTLARARERCGESVQSVVERAHISAADLTLTESGEQALPAARLVDVLHALHVPVGMAIDGSVVLLCRPDGARVAVRYHVPYRFDGSMTRVDVRGSMASSRMSALRLRIDDLLEGKGEAALGAVLALLESAQLAAGPEHEVV